MIRTRTALLAAAFVATTSLTSGPLVDLARSEAAPPPSSHVDTVRTATTPRGDVRRTLDRLVS